MRLSLPSLNLLSPQWTAFSLALLALLAGAGTFLHYFLPDLNVCLSLMALPFVLYVRAPGRYSWRYAIFAAAFLTMYTFAGMKVLFLMATAFAMLFAVEQSLGKLNALPLLLVFILSPVPRYVAAVLGFPLRLWLSESAGTLLSMAGMNVEVKGNVFLLEGEAFAVDPACAGIGLLVTGLVLMVILISYEEKRNKKVLGMGWKAGLILMGCAFVLLANLMRIIATVLLRASPENFLHDMIGILSALLYFLLPVALAIRWSVQRQGREMDTDQSAVHWRRLPHKALVMMLGLIAAIAVLNFHRRPFVQEALPATLASLELPGFQSCITDGGVLALRHAEVLIYVKPPVPFYGPDHYPEMCWRGEGYTLRASEKRILQGRSYNMARLEKDGAQLYTAWWYDNGRDRNTAAFAWRWEQLKGAPGYCLINVTAADPETLVCWLQGLSDFFPPPLPMSGRRVAASQSPSG